MLVVCEKCGRHTRGTCCAFCGASTARPPSSGRSKRGARAAVLATAAIAIACGARTELDVTEESASSDAGGDDASRVYSDACSIPVALYGGPIFDACTTHKVTDE